MALDITTLASTDLLSDSRGDINTNFTNIATDLDALSDNLENLTDGEVTQLEAIGATTISAAQWAYLGDLDQALKKASSITFADLTLSGLTASELTATDGDKKLQSLAVATYPSLTEISYIKGLSSAIQGQIDGKAASLGEDDNYVTDADITLLGNTSGENTGDQDLSGKANVDQTMYIGTTAVDIDRTTATLNLAGIGTLACGAITAEEGGNVPIATTADITYYIDCDAGSDDNPGTDAEPFETIQHAIDILPKCINHTVLIKLKDSQNYAESVLIELFYGGGTLEIISDSAAYASVLNTISGGYGFYFKYCNLSKVSIRYISVYLTANDAEGIQAIGVPNMHVYRCAIGDNNNAGTTAINFENSSGNIYVAVVYNAKPCAVGIKSAVSGVIGVYASTIGDDNYVAYRGGMITDGTQFLT